MRTLLFTACGLALGALVPQLFAAGCSCPPGHRDIPVVAPGTYKLMPRYGEGDMGVGYMNHQLVVTSDQTQVIETFTRNGQSYELRYVITGTEG